jgi:hypothetical protein
MTPNSSQRRCVKAFLQKRMPGRVFADFAETWGYMRMSAAFSPLSPVTSSQSTVLPLHPPPLGCTPPPPLPPPLNIKPNTPVQHSVPLPSWLTVAPSTAVGVS